ncbi:MAG: radical SAM protein [Candidatus Omnitrophota bacterium]
MKIVLIEPRPSDANIYSMISMPLLGPVYLGTILKQHGHQVEIFDEGIHTPDYSCVKADLIGISILTSTAQRGYEIAKKFPKDKVIMGGVHASLLPQEALQYARQVVVGEAEDVIVDVVEGRLTDPIVQGKAVDDLDRLPYPDFSLIKGYPRLAQVVPISASRGCPFDCSFCSVTKLFGRKYRFRSAANIVGEMKSRNTRSYFFCDDNFAAQPKRTRELLSLMLKSDLAAWNCQVRCDAARDAELLKLMSQAGCEAVCVGFDSVNPMTLKAYQKKQTLDEIVHAIKSFHKRKIKIHGMFVLGGEDDDKKTIWDTLKFAIKHKIDTIQMTILTPFPGTKVYDDLESEKRIFTRDWSLYDGQHVVFNPKLLSARELQANVTKAYTHYYSLFKSCLLLCKLRFRNAMLRFMGYVIVKQWVRNNRAMHWLLDHNPSLLAPALKPSVVVKPRLL